MKIIRNPMLEETTILCSLPEDIIKEILSRLAVEPLLRFRCVSKSWRSLIDSQRFVETHLRNSTKNQNYPHQRFILLPRHDSPRQFSLLNLLIPKPLKPSTYDHPIDIDWSTSNIPLGCYNGLVCIRDHHGHFIVWNLSTRIANKLPDSTHRGLNPGFGWIESTGEYKVFAVVFDRDLNSEVARVYTSKTKSWKTLQPWDFPFSGDGIDVGVCVSEKLHWHSIGGIVWFDLKSEVIGTMELPSISEGQWGPLKLGVIGGCLSAVYCGRTIQVWVMKEYGVKESWERVVSLAQILEFLQRPSSPPLIIGPNGNILVLFGAGCMTYNPDQDDAFRMFRIGFHYVESLVSPQVV